MPVPMAPSDLQDTFNQVFADWVKELDLKVVETAEKSISLKWNAGANLVRHVDPHRVVSGQAAMAVADTASVLAIFSINGGLKNCTTVDLHMNFLRPLFEGDIDVEVTALSAGRKTVTTRVEFRMSGSDKLAATATVAFMYLD